MIVSEINCVKFVDPRQPRARPFVKDDREWLKHPEPDPQLWKGGKRAPRAFQYSVVDGVAVAQVGEYARAIELPYKEDGLYRSNSSVDYYYDDNKEPAFWHTSALANAVIQEYPLKRVDRVFRPVVDGKARLYYHAPGPHRLFVFDRGVALDPELYIWCTRGANQVDACVNRESNRVYLRIKFGPRYRYTSLIAWKPDPESIALWDYLRISIPTNSCIPSISC